MIILRLIPLYISTLLFAAHILRFHGLLPAIPVVALLLTLFIRKAWIISFWQLLLVLAAIQWSAVTIEMVYARLSMEMPYLRLLIILVAVILLYILSILWLQRKEIRAFYSEDGD